jgi:hypothetical protein
VAMILYLCSGPEADTTGSMKRAKIGPVRSGGLTACHPP